MHERNKNWSTCLALLRWSCSLMALPLPLSIQENSWRRQSKSVDDPNFFLSVYMKFVDHPYNSSHSHPTHDLPEMYFPVHVSLLYFERARERFCQCTVRVPIPFKTSHHPIYKKNNTTHICGNAVIITRIIINIRLCGCVQVLCTKNLARSSLS